MDRGVKIAIFVASILSLALGLIWDQVLSHARTHVEQTQPDAMGPQRMSASIGSPDIPRMQPTESITPAEPDPTSLPEPAAAEAAAAPTQSTHIVKSGDSWWKLAFTTYQDRGINTKDLQDANPTVKQLKVGMEIVIPAGKATLPVAKPVTQPEATRDTSAPARTGTATDTEYTVQDGDSWWKIAHVHFKQLGFETVEWERANPGINLRPGVKLKVPKKN